MHAKSLIAPFIFLGASLGGLREARAQFELGTRLGYGVPLGKASDSASQDLSKGIAGQVPLWFDIGGRVQDRFYIGGYVALGIGIVGSTIQDDCDASQTPGTDLSCSARDWRFGAQFQYHIGEPRGVHPWVGAGFGYEVVSWSISADGGGQEATVTVSSGGFEFMNLQAGLDVPVADQVALGPFATFTVAQYDSASISCSGDCVGALDQDETIDDKSLHNWLIFGARATFLF